MSSAILAIIVVAALLCLSLSYIFAQLARQQQFLLDIPESDPRRIHQQPTPRIGGPALLLTYGIMLWATVPNSYWDNRQLQGFLIGLFLITLIGILDDAIGLSGQMKLLGQTAVVLLVVIGFQIEIPFVNNPITIGTIEFSAWVKIIISSLWILGTTNTMNFIDGIDGLAVSISITFALVLLGVAILFGQAILLLAIAILLGCGLGFLPNYWRQAKAFLGDGGSMFLGYCIGVLSILSGAKVATTMLILGLPVLDVVNTFWVRYRRGQSLFAADQEHLHYRLLRKGLSNSQTILIIAGISLLFGLVALTNNTTLKVVGLALLTITATILIQWSMRE